MWIECERKEAFRASCGACVIGTQHTVRPVNFWSKKMSRFHRIAVAAAAALAAQGALANVLTPNAVPEPGALGLVGVALAAAVYFGKRRK